MWAFMSGLVLVTLDPAASDPRPSQPQPIVVLWQGPAGCDEASHVRAELARRLGRRLNAPENLPMTISAEVGERDGGGFRVRLRFTTPAGSVERSLEDASCRGLADAIALVASIAIAQREAQLEVAAPPKPAAPPPPPAPAPSAAHPTTPPTRAPTPLRSEVWGRVRIGAALSGMALPRLGVGLDGGLSVGGRRFLGELFGAHRFPTAVPRAQAPSQGGTLRLTKGGLAGCYDAAWSLPRLSAPVCGVFEAGAIVSQGFGLPDSRRAHTLWLAPGGRVGLGWTLVGGLSVEAHSAVVAPLRRPKFVILGDEGPPTVTGPVELQVNLGLGYRFP